MLSRSIKDIFRHLALSGLFAALLAVLTLACAGLFPAMADRWSSLLLQISVGSLVLDRPLVAWLNDLVLTGLLFGLGLECKREILEGELAVASRLILVCLAALGIVGAPMLAHALLGQGTLVPSAIWPAAAMVDLSLVVAVTFLLGERVPTALRTLLLAVGFMGNLVVMTVVGLTDAGQMSGVVAALAGLGVLILAGMNLARVESLSAYVLAGSAVWLVLLGSGRLSLLAGLLTALCVPVCNRDKTRLPLFEACQDVLPTVSWSVFPILAVANGFASLAGPAASDSWSVAGFVLALAIFPGKALGMVGLCWLGHRFGLCQLPPGLGWREVWGVGLLCGAGGVVGLGLVPTALIASGHAAMVRVLLLLTTALSLAAGYFFLRYMLSLRRNSARRR